MVFESSDTSVMKIPGITIPTVNISQIDAFTSGGVFNPSPINIPNINIPQINIPQINIPKIDFSSLSRTIIPPLNGSLSSLDIPTMTTDTSAGNNPSSVSFPNQVTGEGTIIIGGSTRVFSSPEGGNIVFTSSGDDIINGSDYDDVLAGGLGYDQLTGHRGADAFLFGTTGEGVDTITDFNVTEDKILVSASGFGSGLTQPPIGVESIALGFEQLRMGTSALTDSDRFIYDGNSGALFFDADGIGPQGQSQLAQLSPGLAFSNENIHIIS